MSILIKDPQECPVGLKLGVLSGYQEKQKTIFSEGSFPQPQFRPTGLPRIINYRAKH